MWDVGGDWLDIGTVVSHTVSMTTPRRTLTFYIADPQGRPSIRTTHQGVVNLMVDQGWTVTDIIES